MAIIAAKPLDNEAKLFAGQHLAPECSVPVQPTDSLESELRRAAVVIKGTVIAADIKDENIQPRVVSEHDPLLRKAVVETDEILKGADRKKRWTVFYATSDDVLWFHSPKLKKGQAAIFLLQLNQLTFPRLSSYTVLNTLDIQPLEALSQIKVLLKQLSGKGKKPLSD